MALKRGDIVTVALQGDYGKPRPAMIIQSDFFSEHPSITILLITSELRHAPLFRITIEPTPENGLRYSSEIMVDKAQTIASDKIGGLIGHVEERTLSLVTQALAVFLGLV